jgi:hypothetical protein
MYRLGRPRGLSCDELSTICSQVVVHGDIDDRNRIGGDVREYFGSGKEGWVESNREEEKKRGEGPYG